MSELDTQCRQQFQVSVQEVLTSTPKSNLNMQPTSQQRQSERRKVVRETKKAIKQSMDDGSTSTVMSNRLSLKKCDRL